MTRSTSRSLGSGISIFLSPSALPDFPGFSESCFRERFIGLAGDGWTALGKLRLQLVVVLLQPPDLGIERGMFIRQT